MHVRKRWEFRKIRRDGIKYYGKYICFQYTIEFNNPPKLGLTVSRKYGDAVERNLFKRRIRELFRLLRHDLTLCIKLNILPLESAKLASFEDFEKDWINFISYINKGEDEQLVKSRADKSLQSN